MKETKVLKSKKSYQTFNKLQYNMHQKYDIIKISKYATRQRTEKKASDTSLCWVLFLCHEKGVLHDGKNDCKTTKIL